MCSLCSSSFDLSPLCRCMGPQLPSFHFFLKKGPCLVPSCRQFLEMDWGKQNTASAGVHSVKMSRLFKSLYSKAISGPACQTKTPLLNLQAFLASHRMVSIWWLRKQSPHHKKHRPKCVQVRHLIKIQSLLGNPAYRWTTRTMHCESSGPQLLQLLFSKSSRWFTSHLGKWK